MENATKALLIAAAVLIAIVLIALGVKILNSSSDVSGQAENVSGAVSNSVNNAAADITGELNKLPGASK